MPLPESYRNTLRSNFANLGSIFSDFGRTYNPNTLVGGNTQSKPKSRLTTQTNVPPDFLYTSQQTGPLTLQEIAGLVPRTPGIPTPTDNPFTNLNLVPGQPGSSTTAGFGGDTGSGFEPVPFNVGALPTNPLARIQDRLNAIDRRNATLSAQIPTQTFDPDAINRRSRDALQALGISGAPLEAPELPELNYGELLQQFGVNDLQSQQAYLFQERTAIQQQLSFALQQERDNPQVAQKIYGRAGAVQEAFTARINNIDNQLQLTNTLIENKESMVNNILKFRVEDYSLGRQAYEFGIQTILQVRDQASREYALEIDTFNKAVETQLRIQEAEIGVALQLLSFEEQKLAMLNAQNSAYANSLANLYSNSGYTLANMPNSVKEQLKALGRQIGFEDYYLVQFMAGLAGNIEDGDEVLYTRPVETSTGYNMEIITKKGKRIVFNEIDENKLTLTEAELRAQGLNPKGISDSDTIEGRKAYVSSLIADNQDNIRAQQFFLPEWAYSEFSLQDIQTIASQYFTTTNLLPDLLQTALNKRYADIADILLNSQLDDEKPKTREDISGQIYGYFQANGAGSGARMLNDEEFLKSVGVSPKSVRDLVRERQPQQQEARSVSYGANDIRELISGYFPEAELDNVVRLVQQESGGRASARADYPEGAVINGKRYLPEDSIGLFQINILAHAKRIERHSGIPASNKAAQVAWLNIPENNIQIAAELYREQGYNPWKLSATKLGLL